MAVYQNGRDIPLAHILINPSLYLSTNAGIIAWVGDNPPKQISYEF